MKTQTKVDTTLFTMIIATLITGICLSSANSLFDSRNDSQKVRADTVASKNIGSKQL